jgi:hypothetical protein
MIIIIISFILFIIIIIIIFYYSTFLVNVVVDDDAVVAIVILAFFSFLFSDYPQAGRHLKPKRERCSLFPIGFYSIHLALLKEYYFHQGKTLTQWTFPQEDQVV